MTALSFTVEDDSTIFAVLEDFADKPKSKIMFGRKLTKKTTQYGGINQSSTQILGQQLEPIVLTGKWNDRQSGDMGRALRLAQSFDGLAALGKLLRIEWGPYQRWGLLDFTFEHQRLDLIEWRMEITILYDQPPAFIRVTSYKTPPDDQASEAKDQAAELRATIEDSPDGTASDLLALMVTKIAEVENDISSALAILSTVSGSAELTADVARRAAASLYSPVRAIATMRSKTKAASLDVIATVSGVAAVSVRRWTDRVDAGALGLRATLVALIRDLLERARPPADRTWVVRDTDTLATIARSVYGDFSAWTAIADANDLTDMYVPSGTVLVLPNEVPR